MTLRCLPLTSTAASIAECTPYLREILDPTSQNVYYPTAEDTQSLPQAAQDTTPSPGTSLVIATSGTTGTPKLAQLGASQLGASATATHQVLGGPGAWLLALPPHHIAGLQVLLRSLAAGYDPQIQDIRTGFSPHGFATATAALLERTPDARHYTSLVPTQLHKLLTGDPSDPHISAAQEALTHYDAILVGGAALSPDLATQAREQGINIVTTYGSSETAGGCVYNGRPLPGAAVHIDDTGRIWLGGDTIAHGYLGLPNHPAWQKPGWFRTDDHGHWEEDKHREEDPTGADKVLVVDGRMDAAIQSGGLTIFPRIVEEHLNRHPDIAAAAVLGLPDARLGEKVAAVVVPRSAETAAGLTVSALREWLIAAGLDTTATPRTVIPRSSLPTKGIGKIDYRTLREELQ